ncbi:hypothetical protein D3C80_1226750 [compost metagenome]
MLGLEVPLDPSALTLCIDQAVGVAAKAMHVAIAVRNATIGKEDGDLVQRFWGMRPEVPHHLSVLQVGLRVALLGVDKVRELQWVANEEHWRVVTDDVPVAFLGVELHREATRVTLGICRAALATNGGEA